LLYFERPEPIADGDKARPSRYCALDFQETLLAEARYSLRVVRGRVGGKSRDETRYFADEAAAKQAARELAEALIDQGFRLAEAADPWFEGLVDIEPNQLPEDILGGADAALEYGNFRVYTSNYLAVLLDRLAEALRQDPLPPHRVELAVAPSSGMRRWVALELARKLGVAGSIWQPFPASFFQWLADRVLDEAKPEARRASIFEDQALLTWRIFALLPSFESDPDFRPIAGYLDRDPRQRKRYQLADRLARAFDEYQLYRQDWLLAWERDEPAGFPEPAARWQ